MPSKRIHRRAAWLATAAALVASTAIVGTHFTSAHAATEYRTALTFDKNASDPSDSRLYWRVFRVEDDGTQTEVAEESWRAGSGNGVTNECTKNQGWLPDGTYDVTLHTAYNGSIIKGVAFQLNDKTCAGGSATRTELFVHSEMTRTGGQNPAVESQRWDGDSDYASAGCIKLNPDDIKQLAADYRQYHDAESKVTGQLTVTD